MLLNYYIAESQYVFVYFSQSEPGNPPSVKPTVDTDVSIIVGRTLVSSGCGVFTLQTMEIVDRKRFLFKKNVATNISNTF